MGRNLEETDRPTDRDGERDIEKGERDREAVKENKKVRRRRWMGKRRRRGQGEGIRRRILVSRREKQGLWHPWGHQELDVT